MDYFDDGFRVDDVDWDHDDKIRAEARDRENDLAQESQKKARDGN